jgi:SOS-response transcriptional repressor LexA
MTPKQRELYDFILSWIAGHGYSPSYREMCAGLRTCQSNICRLLDEMEAEGFVTRDPRRKRSVKTVKRSDVTLSGEILELTDRYAKVHGISRETATNELLRAALEAA